MLGSVGDILHGKLSQFRQWRCGLSGHEWLDLASGETLVRTYDTGGGYSVMLVEVSVSSICQNCDKTEQSSHFAERIYYGAE